MDPLSIVTSTTALIGCTTKLIKLLHDLHGTLEDAPLLLSSIITECTVVHTSLCVIQDRQTRNAAVRNARSDQVFDTFDVALSGCALILSVLEKDVQSCIVAGKNPQDSGAVKRAKLILEKSHLQELVSQLRGQQQALTLLLTSLQSQSIDEMRDNVQDNQDLLQGIAKVAKRFYVESEYDPSIAEVSNDFDQNIEIDSVITSTRFAFDAEILASKRYQRTLDYLHRIELRQAELNDLKTVAGGNVDQSRIATSNANATRSAPGSANSRTTTETHPQSDPTKSSTSLPGNTDGQSTTSASTLAILPEISVGAWDLQKDVLSDDVSSRSGTESSIANTVDKSIEAGTKNHRRTPSDSIPYFTAISKPDIEGVRRSKSAGSDSNVRPRLSVSPRANQPQMRSNYLNPTVAPAEHRPLRPSVEWLDSTFDTTWAQEGVGNTYLSRTLTHKEVVFVGDSCAGITSAITRAVEKTWMTAYQPTVLDEYSLDVNLNGARFNLRLWDTSGEHHDQLRLLSYANAHLVVIGYAIDSPDSLANVREKWIEEVSSSCPGASIILVGCKLDLRDNTNTIRALEEVKQRPVTYGQGLSVARRVNAMAYIECSSRAEEGGNITALFGAVTKCCILQSHQVSQRRVSKQRSILHFTRKLSRSTPDLTTPSTVRTTFTIESGRLLQPRARSNDQAPSRQQSRRAEASVDDRMTPKEPVQVPELQETKPGMEWRPIGQDVHLGKLGNPLSIRVIACSFDHPRSRDTSGLNVYTFDVEIPETRQVRLFRNGSEMMDLHIEIVEAFPDLNGYNRGTRVIPYMPIPISPARDRQLLYNRFQGPVAQYVNWILNTPQVMYHDLVQQFFTPQVGRDEELVAISELPAKEIIATDPPQRNDQQEEDSPPSSPDTIYTFSPEILNTARVRAKSPEGTQDADQRAKERNVEKPAASVTSSGATGPHPLDENDADSKEIASKDLEFLETMHQEVWYTLEDREVPQLD